VKVLFVGEGRHDIGDTSSNPLLPRLARGTIPTLVRYVCRCISSDSLALAWRDIPRFNPAAKKRGLAPKVVAAVFIAQRDFGCTGTVLVVDRDGVADRAHQLQSGTERALELFPNHAVTWGLAVESVEAWTLAVPESIAAELGVEEEAVREFYPRGVDVEALSERSGKEEHRPKALLERIAKLKHRSDSTQFRQAIAERTDIAALEKACPRGLAPFAAQLRLRFGH
jgi:hypothetical protein